jgi:branched-chain amino acid transport system substrate-binding protein
VSRFVLYLCALIFNFPALGGESAPPLRIALVGTFSGPNAEASLALRHGVRLAVEELNWKGGLRGRALRVEELDDKEDPDVASSGLARLLAHGGVDCVVGLMNNAVAFNLLLPLQEAGIPVLIAGASDNSLTRLFSPPLYKSNYVFRVAASDMAQAEVVAREAIDRRNYKRVAILAEASSLGSAGRDTVWERLRLRLTASPYSGSLDDKTKWVRGGHNIMAAPFVAQFQNGQTDMVGLLRQARTAKVDALIVWGQTRETAAIVKARRKMGWSVPLIGVAELATASFIRAAGSDDSSIRIPTSFVADPINSRRQEFLIALNRHGGKEAMAAVSAAAQGYDSVLLYAAAVTQAGGGARASVRAALEALKSPVFGVIASYERPFSRENHEAILGGMIATGEVLDGRIGFAYRDEVQAIILGRHSLAGASGATQALSTGKASKSP